MKDRRLRVAPIMIYTLFIKKKMNNHQIDFIQHNKKFGKILESIADGFVALDKNWRFTYINGVAEKLLGKNHSELIGKDMWEIFPAPKKSVAYIKHHESME